ncbi:PP2C family protein-serine/threonine phosphatase [Halodurantibacterium flavum]|uniref:PP2C family protein-serine/threonine phosphatase n=1 Tax=Halodurantibacterium flavum TaxID=1382802 RepID=A0ABW4S5D1_9RHOB
MSIRDTLLGLTGFLGLALTVVVALQMVASLAQWREVDHLVASNQLREHLAQAAATLAEERSATVLALRGLPAAVGDTAGLRAATDRHIARVAASFEADADPAQRAEVNAVLDELRHQRAIVDAAGTPQDRAAVALAFHDFGIAAVNRLNAARLAVLVREQPADPVTALAFNLRSQTSAIFEYLIRSRTLIPLLSIGAVGEEEREEIERNAVRIDAALAVLRGNPDLLGRDFPDRIRSFESRYYTLYRPAEDAVLAGGAGTAPDAAVAEAELLLDELRGLLSALFDISRDQLSDLRRATIRSVLLWSGLFVAGALTVLASTLVVQRRIVKPLGDLRRGMLDLAEGRLDTPVPVAARQDEMGAMTDALRVFKANAIRRRRLQDERLALHERLKDAYRQLKIDLEAAAVVQATLLPPPARLGGVAFYSYFRPSRYIAGDTFDVVRRPDGRISFFEIDVAGHGAPAALISVASHHSITQAVLQRQPGQSLGDLAASVNKDWPESFPYFTMILGEIDPAAGTGRLVQAGHPAPLLIGRGGDVRQLGDGGLPVGIIPHATYDEIAFDFAAGDRLLLYSDGLIEAEDAGGRFFTEERLVEIVTTHATSSTAALIEALDLALRSWRGSGSLDDDVTIVILEAETDHERA